MLSGNTSFLDVMLSFKTQKCSHSHPEDKNPTCFYYHSPADSRRQHLNLLQQAGELAYINVLFVPELMSAAQRALFAQNLVEYNYHVLNYKTKPCSFLSITEGCELGHFCPYVHPGDNLDDVAKFRERMAPALGTFLSTLKFYSSAILPSQLPSSPMLAAFFQDGCRDGKRRPRHTFVFPDGEEAYIHGAVLFAIIMGRSAGGDP